MALLVDDAVLTRAGGHVAAIPLRSIARTVTRVRQAVSSGFQRRNNGIELRRIEEEEGEKSRPTGHDLFANHAKAGTVRNDSLLSTSAGL